MSAKHLVSFYTTHQDNYFKHRLRLVDKLKLQRLVSYGFISQYYDNVNIFICSYEYYSELLQHCERTSLIIHNYIEVEDEVLGYMLLKCQ